MRSRVRIPHVVTVHDIERERAEREETSEFSLVDLINPQAEYLSPVEQWALLELRGGDWALLIIDRLKHSTVTAPAARDFEALVTHGLASRTAIGRYALLPRGHFKSSQLIIRLGRELGVSQPRPAHRNGHGYRPRHMADRYFQ